MVGIEKHSDTIHLVEMKHHRALRPDDVAIVQVARHIHKTTASIRVAEATEWCRRTWVLTSRADAVPPLRLRGGARITVLRFAELARGDETWLAFQGTPEEAEPAWATSPNGAFVGESDHDWLVGELEGISVPGRGTTMVEPKEFVAQRKMWAVGLLGSEARRGVYVTADLDLSPGGPFVSLTCSAKIADAVSRATLFGEDPVKHPHARAYLAAKDSVTGSVAGPWRGPVEHDDQLLRTWWGWTGPSAATPRGRAEQGLGLVRHLAASFAASDKGVTTSGREASPRPSLESVLVNWHTDAHEPDRRHSNAPMIALAP